MTTGTVIIDVRTPPEYARGHLRGAVNINVLSPGFTNAVLTLPLNGRYVVYCSSGVRAARATSIMRANGFNDVIDAGGITNASSATGIPIVKT